MPDAAVPVPAPAPVLSPVPPSSPKAPAAAPVPTAATATAPPAAASPASPNAAITTPHPPTSPRLPVPMATKILIRRPVAAAPSGGGSPAASTPVRSPSPVRTAQPNTASPSSPSSALNRMTSPAFIPNSNPGALTVIPSGSPSPTQRTATLTGAALTPAPPNSTPPGSGAASPARRMMSPRATSGNIAPPPAASVASPEPIVVSSSPFNTHTQQTFPTSARPSFTEDSKSNSYKPQVIESNESPLASRSLFNASSALTSTAPTNRFGGRKFGPDDFLRLTFTFNSSLPLPPWGVHSIFANAFVYNHMWKKVTAASLERDTTKSTNSNGTPNTGDQCRTATIILRLSDFNSDHLDTLFQMKFFLCKKNGKAKEIGEFTASLDEVIERIEVKRRFVLLTEKGAKEMMKSSSAAFAPENVLDGEEGEPERSHTRIGGSEKDNPANNNNTAAAAQQPQPQPPVTKGKSFVGSGRGFGRVETRIALNSKQESEIPPKYILGSVLFTGFELVYQTSKAAQLSKTSRLFTEPTQDFIRIVFNGKDFEKVGWFTCDSYFEIHNLGNPRSPLQPSINTMIYRSEVVFDSRDPEYRPFIAPFPQLCQCNLDQILYIRVLDYQFHTNGSKLIGEFKASLRTLLNNKDKKGRSVKFYLSNPEKRLKSNDSNSGTITVKQASVYTPESAILEQMERETDSDRAYYTVIETKDGNIDNQLNAKQLYVQWLNTGASRSSNASNLLKNSAMNNANVMSRVTSHNDSGRGRDDSIDAGGTEETKIAASSSMVLPGLSMSSIPMNLNIPGTDRQKVAFVSSLSELPGMTAQAFSPFVPYFQLLRHDVESNQWEMIHQSDPVNATVQAPSAPTLFPYQGSSNFTNTTNNPYSNHPQPNFNVYMFPETTLKFKNVLDRSAGPDTRLMIRIYACNIRQLNAALMTPGKSKNLANTPGMADELIGETTFTAQEWIEGRLIKCYFIHPTKKYRTYPPNYEKLAKRQSTKRLVVNVRKNSGDSEDDSAASDAPADHCGLMVFTSIRVKANNRKTMKFGSASGNGGGDRSGSNSVHIPN